MKLLLLGGGVFLGRALLDAARQRGHAVTVFNRGRSRSQWPEGVEVLTGDRSGDLFLLEGQHFDAVVDTSGYVPADAGASARAFAASDCYCFVSSISAYASFTQAPVAESAALAPSEGIDAGDREPAHYGAQKAACEAAVRAVFGARALVVRPGLIVGPRDRSGRFGYWPGRALAGGEMLVPDVADAEPIQLIDVRDLAEWMIRLLEAGGRGTFNAIGPIGRPAYSWRELVAACLAEAARRGAAPARVTRIGEAFLLEQGVAPWSELPLWIPSSDAEHHGHSRVDVSRAAAAGLTTRPLADTIAATLDDVPLTDADPRSRGKLTRAREAELLARWRSGAATVPAA